MHAIVTLNAARLEHGRALDGYASLLVILAFEREALVVRRKGQLVELICSRLEGMAHHGEVACRGRGAERGLNKHNDPRDQCRREIIKRESEHSISLIIEDRLGAEITK